MTGKGKLLFLGVGNAALAVNKQAHQYDTRCGTTRRSERFSTLESQSITPILLYGDGSPVERSCLDKIKEAADGADVLVSFPPDGTSDAALVQSCCTARKIIYISTTGVYGSANGVIDERTEVDRSSPRISDRLNAEEAWRDLGAIVLRAPAIYGRNYGLHASLMQNKFRIPGDGTRFSSRIHDEDLAQIILKAFEFGAKKATFVVGGRSPAPYIEVVTWLCEQLEIPVPESVPLDQVHHTLQADRQIDPTRVLTELQIELKYPSYKQGFSHCLNRL